MKSIIRDFAKVCYGLTLLISAQAIAQKKITINPELLAVAKTYSGNQNFKIYPVVSKEVDYHPYVEGEVNTIEYNILLQQLDHFKPAYDKYRNEIIKDSLYRFDVQKILKNIDKYLTSDEKSEIRDNYLIEAQTIANKHNIEIKGENNNLFAKQLNDHGVLRNQIKTFTLHNGKKSSSKKDIEFYKNKLQEMRIPSINISYDAKTYLQLLDEEQTIKKTELGQVLSDKTSKKLSYFIIETPVNTNVLIGEFEKLANEYSLVYEDVINRYSKNELTTDNSGDNVTSSRFPIVKKTGSEDMYYIMSDDFLFRIEKEIGHKRYLNMGNSAEYKTWKAKYQSLQSSAQTNVNACENIIARHTYRNRLGEKLYDSSTFTTQEKASFNKNLDVLQKKLEEIKELEQNYKELYAYYIDKASIDETVKSYNLSSFYNNTRRAY
ncbi:hypothetical protein NAT51_09250 [Flavobacterium amniphilum]|uniref:hypothetical protein n=1 Tax=Flavobacterium amniphilum TaxID=1834035 RepID=UPI002029D164|nr:hypothetical protein [Flavobacterium amniphilum]MCL9805708.1 hypothetical protein [Flavobacterium amniphilum]